MLTECSDQMRSLLSRNNFKLALKRLQTAQRSLYKDLYLEDLQAFGFYADENIDSLINDIREEIFSPEKSYRIFIPKKDNRVRPLSLLKFKDLLIYQAIVNVIVDSVYDEISSYYNVFLFGNVVVNPELPEKDKIFFYRPWKEQWKKFEEKTKEYYESGYCFLSEFDIASFFDTIDHNILRQILKNTYGIENDLLLLLSSCLESWTSDSGHITFKSGHGIPQGPICSAFLADLYLLHLDLELKKSDGLDIKYIRYVDDIRIFSKDRVTAQKSVALLDLLARDLGLIPQGSKISISQIADVDEMLRHQKSKFSAIAREHKQKNGELKARTHRKLKKRFVKCFDSESNEKYLDKTLIGFSLYKLNKDEKVKEILIAEYEKLYTHFPAILFYLRQHFSEDETVREWLVELISNEDLLFQHIVALVLKYFPDLPFIESIYKKYVTQQNRHWLVNFFIVNWLRQNNKKEIITSDFILCKQADNYFVKRELNRIRYELSNDSSYKNMLLLSLLEDKDSMVSLQGIYIQPTAILRNTNISATTNSYVRYISSEYKIDYIVHILKEKFSIGTPEKFFNTVIWDSPDLYHELNCSFALFYQSKEIDASKSLLNLNSFNNLVFDKMYEKLGLMQKSEKYGVNLDSGLSVSFFPEVNSCFIRINKIRNERTEAHPYDSDGKLRVKIKFDELNSLVKKEVRALRELCSYTF